MATPVVPKWLIIPVPNFCNSSSKINLQHTESITKYKRSWCIICVLTFDTCAHVGFITTDIMGKQWWANVGEALFHVNVLIKHSESTFWHIFINLRRAHMIILILY